MDTDQRNILKVFRPKFVRDVDQIDDLIDNLEANSVLADSTIESIKDTNGRQEKARKILDHLVRRPSPDFDKFYQCLILSDNADLADKLKPECAPCKRIPKKSSAPSASKLPYPIQLVNEHDKGGSVRLKFGEMPSQAAEESLIEEDELPEKWPDPNRSILDLVIKKVEAANMKTLFAHQKSTEFKGYKMTSNPRGRAIIINNTKFKTLGERTGNDADVFALKQLLIPLKFTTIDWNNYSYERLKRQLETESRNSQHWDASAFILIVLSHGVRGAIKTVDEEDFKVDDIMECFNRDNCPALVGKPKMFFIQACQGTTHDKGEMTDSGSDDLPTGVENIQISQGENMTDAGAEKVPLYSDMIIVNATTPNFVSWRSENGTWFIQAIVDVFAKFSHKEHLGDLLLKVMNLVARGQTRASGKVQISSISFETLRDKVYFFPGLPEQEQGGSGRLLLLD